MPAGPAEVGAVLRSRRLGVLVTGGIAAYKIAELVSSLVQAGAQVRVAMTEPATRFVGPATFHGLSGRPVATDLWAPAGAPEPHVELGDWAEVCLVAPATANVLAAVAQGAAADLVTATVLAARCPVVIAPAMNDAMWAKPAVQDNVALLRRRGHQVLEPAAGHLASGHSGPGRLPDPGVLLRALERTLRGGGDWTGRRVLVSAGGTREPIDPVRYVGNHSSGKMGRALAEAALARGAEVTLVTTVEEPAAPGLRVHRVETARDMLAALREELADADVLVMAAAVADFRPAEPAAHKIRREGREELVLRLERNVDVLGALQDEPGADRVFRVGFAAEDGELEQRARDKLERKRLDAILANDVTRPGIGFAEADNAGLLLFRDGGRLEIPRVTKREMADRILDAVAQRLR